MDGGCDSSTSAADMGGTCLSSASAHDMGSTNHSMGATHHSSTSAHDMGSTHHSSNTAHDMGTTHHSTNTAHDMVGIHHGNSSAPHFGGTYHSSISPAQANDYSLDMSSAPPYDLLPAWDQRYTQDAIGPGYNHHNFPVPPPPYETGFRDDRRKSQPCRHSSNESHSCCQGMGRLIGHAFVVFAFFMLFWFVALLISMVWSRSFIETDRRGKLAFTFFGFGMISLLVGHCILAATGKNK